MDSYGTEMICSMEIIKPSFGPCGFLNIRVTRNPLGCGKICRTLSTGYALWVTTSAKLYI